MFNRQLVLVAIDHATDVERTMGVALRTAKAREADVHVVHVVPHAAVRVGDRLSPWTFESHDDAVATIGTRLAAILRSVDDDGLRVQRVTLQGTPEQVIPAYAQLHRAAMLVVERHYGSSRFWRSGRVVNQLARTSPVPLLVLPRVQRRERQQPALRRILALVDFSIASAVALRTAVDLSRRHGGRITLVHALKDVPHHMVFSGSEAWEVVRRLPARTEAVAERLRRTAAFFGARDVDTEVATGLTDGVILEIATRSQTDLIVLGVAHRSWLDRLLLGSTARRVLRRATVPVLVVPVVAGAHAWPDTLNIEQISSRVRTEPAVDRVAA